MAGPTSRWRLALRGAAYTLLFAAAAAGGFAVGVPAMVERAGLSAVRQLETRLGVAIDARAVTWTWSGHVAVDGLVVRAQDAPADEAPLFTAEHLLVDADVRLGERKVALRTVQIDQAVATAVRRPDGRDNVASVVAGLRALLGPRDPQAAAAEATGGALRYLAREVPTVSLARTQIVVDAPWPKLPLGLTVPKVVSLSDGAVTVTADAPTEPTVLTVKADFKETSLDPGFGLGADLTVGLDGVPRDVGLRFDRPVRFYLGERVAGVKGARWTPDGFEVSELQLSVPLDPDKPAATIGAAATVARLAFSPEPRELLRRIAEVGGELAVGPGGVPSVAAIIGALDEVVLERPAAVMRIGPGGHHSFEDLVPAMSWPAGRGAALVAADPAELLVAAGDAATRRLLGTPETPGDAPTVRSRVVTATTRLEALADAVAPRVVRALAAFPLKQLDVTEGRIALSTPLGPMNLEQVVVRGRSEGGARVDVSLVAPEVTRKPAQLAARLGPGGQGLEVDVAIAGLPLAYLGDALPAPLSADGDGVLYDSAVHIEWAGHGLPWLAAGHVQMRDIAISASALAAEPLRGLDLGLTFELGLDPSTEKLALGKGRVRVADVGVDLVAQVERYRERPQIHLEARLPETSVQAVVDAFPRAMIPQLEGLAVTGRLGWALTADLDTGNLDGLVIDSRPALVDFSVRSMGRAVNFEDLRGAFSYGVLREDGTPGSRMSGPLTGRWTALEEVSPYLAKAVTTTEDGSFYKHSGISTNAIKESIVTNLKEGGFVRGASTITQQVVKNLFLGGKKTLSRKLQELFIAWQLEQALSKDEIMALYLNIIEFGPGVYGVTEAADRWFGKRPGDLTLLECIFLSSIIPNPRSYYSFLEAGHVSVRWRNYLRVLLNIMVERGKITQEEADAQAPYDPVFTTAATLPLGPGGVDVDLPLPDAPPPDDPEDAPPPW